MRHPESGSSPGDIGSKTRPCPTSETIIHGGGDPGFPAIFLETLMHWLYLALAVLFETIGTTALQASQQFTRIGPSVLMVASYAVSFYLLAQLLRVMPVGVVYAIWSGLGICFIAVIAYFLFDQKLDLAAIIGIAMIIAGVAVINLFSNTTAH